MSWTVYQICVLVQWKLFAYNGTVFSEPQGLFWFTDLTRPSVVLADWSTPYGVNGLFLPLGLFGLYNAGLQYSAPARSPGASACLKVKGCRGML